MINLFNIIMAYHIQVKDCVDFVLVYENNQLVEYATPAECYEEMVVDIKQFNINTKFTEVDLVLLGYGVGGTAQYNITDLTTEIKSPMLVIINTPKITKAVILEFPPCLRDILKVPKYVRLSAFKSQENAVESLARGIDPQAKNWNTILPIHEIKDFDWKNTLPVIVHCLTLIRAEKICS